MSHRDKLEQRNRATLLHAVEAESSQRITNKAYEPMQLPITPWSSLQALKHRNEMIE